MESCAGVAARAVRVENRLPPGGRAHGSRALSGAKPVRLRPLNPASARYSHAKTQAHLAQGFLDGPEPRTAKARNAQYFIFGLLDQIADGAPPSEFIFQNPL